MTIFRWRKDASGYDLSPDRKMIVRRGGALVEYDPADVKPPLHRQFADLFFWGFHPEGGLNPAPRGFQRDEALLNFVSEYGFLGSEKTGAEADQEAVDYLMKVQSEIAGFLHSGGAFGKTLLPLVGGRHAGPNLRMYLAPDKNGRVRVHYEAESLYAWLWHRVADDLSSGVRWDGMPCLNCFAPIGRGPGNGRKTREYCSANCRVRFNRLRPDEQKKRKAEAREHQRNREV